MHMQDALQVRDGEREQMEGGPDIKVKQGRKWQEGNDRKGTEGGKEGMRR